VKKLATLLIVGGVLASGCGDDGSGDGDIAAFCDAIDRLEHSGDPFDHVDDRDAFVAAVDEQAAAMADARSNAPSEIRDAVEQAADEMEDVYAVLRGLEDPSDESEVEAAAAALDDGGTGDTGGLDFDVYLVENCDNRSSGDSELQSSG
jgi:hypothetical protein